MVDRSPGSGNPIVGKVHGRRSGERQRRIYRDEG
jgi:hypothetical protein